MQRTSDNHYILISSYPECHFYIYLRRHRHTELSNNVLPLHICFEFSSVVTLHSGSHHLYHRRTCYVLILMFTTGPFTLETLLLTALSSFWY